MSTPSHTRWEDRIRELGLLDPTDREARAHRRGASHLGDLSGRRAGFLDNRKGNADLLLARLREVFQGRYELADVVWRPKAIYSRPASEQLLDELAEKCDFVITAIGD